MVGDPSVTDFTMQLGSSPYRMLPNIFLKKYVFAHFCFIPHILKQRMYVPRCAGAPSDTPEPPRAFPHPGQSPDPKPYRWKVLKRQLIAWFKQTKDRFDGKLYRHGSLLFEVGDSIDLFPNPHVWGGFLHIEAKLVERITYLQ